MKFDSSFFGEQGLTADDRNYCGSRYAEVRDACFQNAYYLNWGAPGEPPLPEYGVTLNRVLQGIWPGGRPWAFLQAAGRALDAKSDLRWGPDRRGYRRLLHPNGVILFGRWKIDEETAYSGYFAKGKEALIVGRYSTCCSQTRRGRLRSLSLVGKLYPTTDPDHSDPLRTANFITQEDLGGSRTNYINDVELRNAPDTTPWRRGLGLPILLLTGVAFLVVDREPTVRQLYPIAELAKPAADPTAAPAFMKLTVNPSNTCRIPGDDLDFRDEILSQIYDRGDPLPKRHLEFDISVTDSGQTSGMFLQRRTFQNWRRIGRIEFTEAVASYNGDFVLHFHHPPWRRDRNDRRSTSRKLDDLK